jgi:protein-tyrosine phosphatase
VSIIDKRRKEGSLDPEVNDRVEGMFWIPVLNRQVYFDMPIISHVWQNFYVGGVEDYVVLPKHFRNVFQLFPLQTYEVNHEPVSHWKFDLDDSIKQDLSEVDEIARLVVEAGETGDTIVHCQAGMNRSCLVMSRVLQMEGFTPRESVDMIREKRTPWALCNPAFERWTLETPVRGREEEG